MAKMGKQVPLAKEKSWWKFLIRKPINYSLQFWAFVVLLFILMTTVLLKYRNQLPFSSVSTRKYRNVSSILRELVESANELQTVEFQYKKLLLVDPFAHLVEQHVMPAHDKMSSLKRQVKIYENMDRSLPPSNFMESSFKDLNFIDNELHRFESQYGQILASTKRELDSLRRDAKLGYEKLASVINDETYETLKESGIYLDDPALKVKEDLTADFDDIIERISQAADLFGPWESARAELKQIVRTQNITVVHQTYGTPILSLLKTLASFRKEIDQFLETNGPHIRLTFTFLERQLEDRRNDEANVVAVQNRFKKRYDRLTEMLSDDVLSTRERVKRLRFLSKRTTEL